MDDAHGDFNYDGRVNLADFNILSARFGTPLEKLFLGLSGPDYHLTTR